MGPGPSGGPRKDIALRRIGAVRAWAEMSERSELLRRHGWGPASNIEFVSMHTLHNDVGRAKQGASARPRIEWVRERSDRTRPRKE